MKYLMKNKIKTVLIFLALTQSIFALDDPCKGCGEDWKITVAKIVGGAVIW